MQIPSQRLEDFVREIADACLTSQGDRIQRGLTYKNYFLYGSGEPNIPAQYNKIWTYIDDLESLLYSPVSLKIHIGDPDLPSVLSEAKGRAAASRLRTHARRSETDSMISAAVGWALVKGKTFIKPMWKGKGFKPELVMPEAMGVLKENYGRLDEGMEAFVHSMLLTEFELRRLVWNMPNRESLLKKAKRFSSQVNLGMTEAGGNMQVITGGISPFQPTGSATPNNTRGIVGWMGGGSATLDPRVSANLVRLDEVWIWDDNRDDWATFQMIGDMLIFGKLQTVNALAYNPASKLEIDALRGKHPFVEFCPNPLEGYFWGRSEVVNVALLQENINRRLIGINQMLRKEENPSTKFTGTTGVNQNTINRYRSPGGYFAESNPNAKIENEAQPVPKDVWVAIHENERMFDEMAGTPPIAKGHGESGVRSQGHAETLVRMFSPRFKDRALLVERDVEGLFSLMLDIARTHDPKSMTTWVGKDHAGSEGEPENTLILPPVPGQVAVRFTFANLDEDVTVSVDGHSASPAFSAEARALAFDLLKVGVMSPDQLVEHVDAPDPDGLIAGFQRRMAEKALEIQQLSARDPAAALKAVSGGKK